MIVVKVGQKKVCKQKMGMARCESMTRLRSGRHVGECK